MQGGDATAEYPVPRGQRVSVGDQALEVRLPSFPVSTELPRQAAGVPVLATQDQADTWGRALAAFLAQQS